MYRFTSEDQIRYADRIWRCPVRLVTDGTWAELWRAGGKDRGGGAATSVLAVLGIHAGDASEVEDGWSKATYLSRRRIARLAGLDKDTVAIGLDLLKSKDLIRMERVRHRSRRLAGWRTLYLLSERVLAHDRQSHVPISGALIYGGTWSLLPTSACRHLYVAIAAEDKRDRLRRKRAVRATGSGATRPLSYSDLMRLTGIGRSAMAEALHVLLAPMPLPADAEHAEGDQVRKVALVVRGEAPSPRQARWYSPEPTAQRLLWPPSFLQDPDAVASIRDQWRAEPAGVPAGERPLELPRYIRLDAEVVGDQVWLLRGAVSNRRRVTFEFQTRSGDRWVWRNLLALELQEHLAPPRPPQYTLRAQGRDGKERVFRVDRMRRLSVSV